MPGISTLIFSRDRVERLLSLIVDVYKIYDEIAVENLNCSYRDLDSSSALERISALANKCIYDASRISLE